MALARWQTSLLSPCGSIPQRIISSQFPAQGAAGEEWITMSTRAWQSCNQLYLKAFFEHMIEHTLLSFIPGKNMIWVTGPVLVLSCCCSNKRSQKTALTNKAWRSHSAKESLGLSSPVPLLCSLCCQHSWVPLGAWAPKTSGPLVWLWQV